MMWKERRDELKRCCSDVLFNLFISFEMIYGLLHAYIFMHLQDFIYSTLRMVYLFGIFGRIQGFGLTGSFTLVKSMNCFIMAYFVYICESYTKLDILYWLITEWKHNRDPCISPTFTGL